MFYISGTSMHEQNRWQGRNCEKDQIRNDIWQRLVDQKAVSTSPFGRIPAFNLASQASAILTSLPIWKQAQTIKCNPDTAQIPVRLAALKTGKTLLMAVPQLKQEACFVLLTAQQVMASEYKLEEAAIAKNALKVGIPITFEEMPTIDLVVVGCVAVDRIGGRTGKGAGFADLELGILQQFELICSQTPIVTTVDELQVVNQALPMEAHDWPLDWITTPTKAITTHTHYSRPMKLDWSAVQTDQWQNIPILKELRAAQLKQKIVVRPMKSEDASQLLEGVNQVIAEQKYLASAVPFDKGQKRPYLDNILSNHYPMLVAEYEGDIVGCCDIIPYPELGFQHMGRLGMWILPEFRRMGIGRSLLQQSLAWAKQFGLEKIELQVYGDNEKAIGLYQSEGFLIEGKRQGARKLGDRYQDMLWMGLFLNAHEDNFLQN